MILRYTARFLAFILFLSVYLPTSGLAQTNTPPSGSLLLEPRGDQEGTQQHPFEKSQGFKVHLSLVDPDPTSYVVNWTASWGGSFCPGGFQWFGQESRAPTFAHPRVRTGLAYVRITALVLEDGETKIVKIARDIFTAKDPRGCEGDGLETPPSGVSLVPTPLIVSPGGTISLKGLGKDGQSESLTFKFYATSTASSSVRGELFSTQQVAGCIPGCSKTVNFPAGNRETTHYFTLEVSDETSSTLSSKVSVKVIDGGDPGGDPGIPPEEGPSGKSCACPSGVMLNVDAGPSRVSTLGGLPYRLSGGASGAQGTAIFGITMNWSVVSNGGLSAEELRIDNAHLAEATLISPDIDTDRQVQLRLTAESDCTCSDDIFVDLLADETPEADLSLEKTADSSNVDFGDQFDYMLVVRNLGPDAAESVRITDLLPPEVEFVSVDPASNCSAQTGAVICEFNNIAPNALEDVRITVRATQDGAVDNSATVTSNTDDPNLANNSDGVLVQVAPVAVDLKIEKNVSLDRVVVGDEFDYLISVTNHGPDDATGVEVVDALPSQVAPVFASSSAPGSGCGFGQTVTCSLGTLHAGDSAELTIRVKAVHSGEPQNTASVTSDQEESNPQDNQDSVSNEISSGVTDLSVEKTAQSSDVGQGQEVVFTLTATNHGPDAASGVVLVDDLPEGLVFVSSDGASCDQFLKHVECSVGDLALDESKEVFLRVRADLEGSITNEASIEGHQDDTDSENNTDSYTIKVVSSSFVIAPGTISIPNTFVGVAVFNPRDEMNALNIVGLDEDGAVTEELDLSEPIEPLGQRAFLTGEFAPNADVLLARGRQGAVRGFFMFGDNAQTKLDGIGGQLIDAKKLYFPLVKQGGGVDTHLFLFNPEDEAADVTALLYNATGQLVNSASLTIANMGSFSSTLAEVFPGLQLDEGYLKVESSLKIRGYELLADDENFASFGGQAIVQTRNLAVPQYLASQNDTTFLRIANLGTAEVGGTVIAFDNSGQELGRTGISIPSKNLMVRDIRDLFTFDLSQTTTGYLKLELSGGTVGIFATAANVIAAVSYKGVGFEAALPMLREGAKETLFLQVAQSGEFFDGLAILNTGSAAAQGSVRVFDAAGHPTGERAFELQPGQRIVDLLNGPTFFGVDFEQIGGHLRVSSDQPVVAFALFGIGGRFLSAIEGQTDDQ